MCRSAKDHAVALTAVVQCDIVVGMDGRLFLLVDETNPKLGRKDRMRPRVSLHGPSEDETDATELTDRPASSKPFISSIAFLTFSDILYLEWRGREIGQAHTSRVDNLKTGSCGSSIAAKRRLTRQSRSP
jgi:hypothetical protein